MPLPEIVTRKFGPLPGWAWGGLGLGVALAVSTWQRNKAASDDAEVEQSYELPESLQPTYVFQNYDQDIEYGDVITIPGIPPGGGRPSPPSRPMPMPYPVPSPPKPKPTPIPPPKPAPKGQWVTVVPWKPKQPAGTPSTIWGIAEKVFGAGKVSRTLTNQIWAAPQNAGLRAQRKKPELIRPGDKVWVPQ